MNLRCRVQTCFTPTRAEGLKSKLEEDVVNPGERAIKDNGPRIVGPGAGEKVV